VNQNYKRIPLNGARLRAARFNLGLGTREFARESGTTFTLIDSMEKENFVGASTTLAEFRALARAASLTMTDLLDEDNESNPGASAPPTDVQRLAAVLISDPRMQKVDDICQGLGWTLNQLHEAADSLNASFEPLGLRVHRNPGLMCLRPRTTSGLNDAQSVDSRRSGREGLNISEASILRRALHGDLSDKLPESSRPALGHLINLGYLRPGTSGEPFNVPTDATNYAFDI